MKIGKNPLKNTAMQSINAPLCFIFSQALILVLLLFPAWSQGADNNCLGCHKQFVDVEYQKSYIHKPFLQKKCVFCHSPDWVDNAEDSDGKTIFPQKRKILGSDENPALMHLLSLPKESELSILFLEAKRESAEPFRVKLIIPPFESIETLASDAKPPDIYDVQVIEIKKDNIVSATIRWHTNELSNARIYFGVDQPDSQSYYSAQFLSDHTAELYPLLADVTYSFTITSEDIYGNSKQSQVYTFSTEKKFKLKETSHYKSDTEPFKMKSSIFRSEENYLVRVSANQHITIELSTYDQPDITPLIKESKTLPQGHPPLKSVYETNLLICSTCHQALSEKFSHPVHFRARLGNNIPDDYPRLPNGQMSCLTCHQFHASNYPFHLRKSVDRELCIGCHKRKFRR